jgi:flagellar basal body rod protein FlgG
MISGINGISASSAGLLAYGVQLANAAHNVANVNSDGYKKTVATVSEDNAGLPKVDLMKFSSPGPMIQVEGLLKETSNVNLAEEIPRMMIAQRAYEANIQAVKAQDETFKSTVDILA